jgi:hypothetical protein
LVPYGSPPKGGWPLLAWSHGTSGVATNCAPSLMKSLFYNWEGLYEYVMLGYAVVATDYAELGTAGRHAYLDMLSNATDVVNSAPAAHAAVPGLSQRWLVIGHSQGGLSSLGLAQLEGRIKDPNFLGTVALAGASDLQDALDSVLKVRLPVLNGLVAFWIYGVKTVYPEFQSKDVLTDKALAIFATSPLKAGVALIRGLRTKPLASDHGLRGPRPANSYSLGGNHWVDREARRAGR